VDTGGGERGSEREICEHCKRVCRSEKNANNLSRGGGRKGRKYSRRIVRQKHLGKKSFLPIQNSQVGEKGQARNLRGVTQHIV